MIAIADINSAGIRTFAAERGATEAEFIGSTLIGAERYTLYEVAGVKVIDTNADPVFEGAEGFEELEEMVVG